MSEITTSHRHEGFARRFAGKLNVRLIGAAGGVLLALFIAPVTRRLVLSQVELALSLPSGLAPITGSPLGNQSETLGKEVALRATRAVYERHPDDLQIQLVAAISLPFAGKEPVSTLKVGRLRALENRFPDSASLYANILRYEAIGEVRVNRNKEEFEFADEPVPQKDRLAHSEIDPEILAAYDRDAAAGERLDPDNAYFPFMRAIGLFSAHRDAEALAAVSRAAQKPHWQEYYLDELRGEWRVQDEAFVNNSALIHSGSAAAILFPEYAQMRAAVRISIFEAMQAERAGRIEEGFAIRMNVMRIGSQMRMRTQSLIGSLVGIALNNIAISRPCGAVPIRNNEHNVAEMRAQRLREFDAYLLRSEHAEAIPGVHAELEAGEQVRELIQDGTEDNSPFYLPLQHLILWWIVNLLTLSNILWLLLLGGIAGIALRNRRLQAGLALPGYARLALPLGLVGGVFFAPLLFARISPILEKIQVENGFNCLVAGLLPALLLLAIPAKSGGRERGARLGVFAGSLFSGALLTALYFWQARGMDVIVELVTVFFDLSGSSSPGGQNSLDLACRLLWGTPCVSLLILIGVSVVSGVYRVPLSVGLARGFRGLAAPVAAALFLAYGVTILFTVRAEAEVQYGLERTLEQEGPYLATLSGKSWPRTDVAQKLVTP